MATEIVHEHDHTTGDGSGIGAVIGVILFVILLMFLLYFFGSGMFRGFTGGGTNIQVPDHVNVNLNQGAGGK